MIQRTILFSENAEVALEHNTEFYAHVQLFERILEIPITWSEGRASGEVLP